MHVAIRGAACSCSPTTSAALGYRSTATPRCSTCPAPSSRLSTITARSPASTLTGTSTELRWPDRARLCCGSRRAAGARSRPAGSRLGSWIRALPGVERVEAFTVVVLDDPALDLHARRQLAGFHRQVVVEHDELLDRLPAVELDVELVDVALHHVADGVRCGDLGIRLAGHAVMLRPRRERVGIQRDDGRAEVALIAVHDELARVRADRLEPSLDHLRRDVLARGRLEQILLPVGDPDEALRIDLADVAGAEPAVIAQRRGSRHVQGVIAGHDARSLDQDLPVGRDAELGARE